MRRFFKLDHSDYSSQHSSGNDYTELKIVVGAPGNAWVPDEVTKIWMSLQAAVEHPPETE